MIKDIALRKGVSSKEIAHSIRLYENNDSKIYGLNDMDSNDIAQISYLLEFNFLKEISEKYLSHIPVIGKRLEQENYYIELDIKTKELTTDIGSCDFLQKINIGQYIRGIAEKNGWNQQDMAQLLHCSQSTVSALYRYKSLKIKKLLWISEVLKRNLIAEVYLSKMFIISSPDRFARCILTMTPKEIRIENPDDKTFLMVYYRKQDEK